MPKRDEKWGRERKIEAGQKQKRGAGKEKKRNT